jgi:signal transduction histidine kinase
MGRNQTRVQQVGRAYVGPFTVLDWAPTVCLVPLALVETVGGGADHLVGPPAGVAACLVAAAVALLWRRRHALPVLGVVCASILGASFVWGSSQASAGVFTMAVAVFACGVHAPRPWSLVAIPTAITTTLLFIANDPADTLSQSWTWSLNLLWIYGLGAWVHQNQQLLAQAGAESAALAAAAAAEDRVRIARELHDVLGHNLAVMIVQSEAADEILDSDPARAHRALANVADTGRAALDDIRGLVGALRLPPTDAPDTGVVAGPGVDAVPGLVKTIRASGLPVVLDMSGDLTRVPAPVSQAAYRVVQEALTNTLRHAGPVPTRVTVAVAHDQLQVRVHDDGDTQAPTPSRGASPGHGLRGMRERIEGVGGQLQAQPDPAGGFTVTADLPVAAVTP